MCIWLQKAAENSQKRGRFSTGIVQLLWPVPVSHGIFVRCISRFRRRPSCQCQTGFPYDLFPPRHFHWVYICLLLMQLSNCSHVFRQEAEGPPPCEHVFPDPKNLLKHLESARLSFLETDVEFVLFREKILIHSREWLPVLFVSSSSSYQGPVSSFDRFRLPAPDSLRYSTFSKDG